MTLRISREELQRQGFFSSLATDVDCQCKTCDKQDFFKCSLCERQVPYCFGVSDEFDDLCDDCAVRQMNHQEYLAVI